MFPWLFLLSAWSAPAPPLASEMHARYAALTAARDAVVAGRLADAKAAIAPLAERDPAAPFPPAWEVWVVGVEASARTVASARDLPAAAAGVANVAAACAACHQATGGGPAIGAADDLPPQAWQPGQNMLLHEWALGWMWLGLLGDDDDAWLRGASELDDHPVDLRFDRAGGGSRELEQLVYVVANKARTTDPVTERAVLYGQLLGVCAECHTRSGRGGR
jgi:mono/diheme cytochrome c family protein